MQEPLDRGSYSRRLDANTPMTDGSDESRFPGWPRSAFVQKVLIVVGIVALTYFAWLIRNAFLLAFAGILVAAILFAAAEPIERWIGLPHRWALLVAGLLILALLSGFMALIGAHVSAQTSALLGQLPQAIDNLEQRLGVALPNIETLKQDLQQQTEQSRSTKLPLSGQLLSWIAAWGATALEVLTSLILVIIAGVFFSAQPDTYRRGFVKLFPKGQQERVDDTLILCGRSLRLWLIAQFIAMAIVGVLVGAGTWLIGLPGPLALGVFAGLTEFVPVLGPIMGAVPAVIFAATQGFTTLLWTVLLFVAVQQLESNVLTPILERKVVNVPPALFLISVLAFGLLFGMLGLLLAAPLTVVTFVAVKKLYVRDTLGEATAVPGEK